MRRRAGPALALSGLLALAIAPAVRAAPAAQPAPPPEDARVSAIVREMPFTGVARALADAYRFAEAHPGVVGRQHLWIFIGDVEQGRGRLARAASAYAAARAIGDGGYWGTRARMGAADVLRRVGRYREARALYEGVLAEGDPALAPVAIQRVAEVRRERIERRLAWMAVALLATFALAAVGLARTRGPLAAALRGPLPLEVTIEATVLGALAVAGLVIQRGLVPGLCVAGAGELGVTWLAAAAARALRGRAAARWSLLLLLALLAIGAAAAVLFLFAYGEGLVYPIGETLAYGPDG